MRMTRHVLLRKMTPEDSENVIRWMNSRIRSATGNASLSFRKEWLPETGLSAWEGKVHGKVHGKTERRKLLAAAVLYLEKSSAVAVCGWCVANPENSPSETHNAVRSLLEAMPGYASSMGAKILLATFGNNGINKILDSIGFSSGDRNVEHKVKILE